MRYTLLCPSPLNNDKSIKSLCDEYIKRIHGTVEIIEIKTKISAAASAAETMSKQGQALIDALNGYTDAYIIAMDERGKIIDSPGLAAKMDTIRLNGQSHIVFVIGGAHGLTDEIRQKADFLLSFGKMVWPHRMVGLMLFEQIYRAQCISSGHPYHKG